MTEQQAHVTAGDFLDRLGGRQILEGRGGRGLEGSRKCSRMGAQSGSTGRE